MSKPSRSERRARRMKRRAVRPHVGAPPGTLTSDPDAAPTEVRLIQYDENHVDEGVLTIDEALERVGRRAVTWIDVIGLADIATIERIGRHFNLHGLSLEDVTNVNQRPKMEEYDDHLFICLRMATPSERFQSEQVSLFVGDGFVVTFQEQAGDSFEPVRDRLRQSRGRIRTAGADYLAYALLDAVVDHYIPVVDSVADRLEELEDRILAGASDDVVARLLAVRHDLRALRRVAVPLRSLVAAMQSEQLNLVTADTRIYLRDCHDHAVNLLDQAESWRELAANLMDLHLAVSGQQLNAVMKVLTIIATIFIPLSFIAGVYGMNFDPKVSGWNMPELGWAYGYPFAIGLMVIVVVVQLLYFRRRGWLGTS